MVSSLALGIVFLYHGATKNVTNFANSFNLPIYISILVIFAEISGGLGYFIGALDTNKYFGQTITQWASVAVIPVLIGAIYLVHAKNGFNFMKNGYEYQFTLLMMALYMYFKDL